MARVLAGVALVVVLGSACSGSSSPASSGTTHPAASHAAAPVSMNALPPIDLRGRVSGGDRDRVRVLEHALQAPVGANVALLTVPTVGTLHVHCSATPTTRFVLTAWAKGEGPPLVQHTHSVPRHPLALIPLNRLEVPPVAGGGGRESYDVWQVGVFSEAFSGTATVWATGLTSKGHCDLQAEALLVTHGAFPLLPSTHP